MNTENFIYLQIKLMEFLLHNISARKIKWSLVAAKTECTGQEERWIGKVQDVETCARSCKGVSSMFIFGTNDFGEGRCNKDGCNCMCETSAWPNGTCSMFDPDKYEKGYRLFKYDEGKN